MIIYILYYLGIGLIITIGLALSLLYDSNKTRIEIVESKTVLTKGDWLILTGIWLIWPVSLIIVLYKKIAHANKTQI